MEHIHQLLVNVVGVIALAQIVRDGTHSVFEAQGDPRI